MFYLSPAQSEVLWVLFHTYTVKKKSYSTIFKVNTGIRSNLILSVGILCICIFFLSETYTWCSQWKLKGVVYEGPPIDDKCNQLAIKGTRLRVFRGCVLASVSCICGNIFLQCSSRKHLIGCTYCARTRMLVCGRTIDFTLLHSLCWFLSDDGSLAKALVSLMLTLNARHKGSIRMVRVIIYCLVDLYADTPLTVVLCRLENLPRMCTISWEILMRWVTCILFSRDLHTKQQKMSGSTQFWLIMKCNLLWSTW